MALHCNTSVNASQNFTSFQLLTLCRFSAINIFFIFLYCKLSRSRTTFLVLSINSSTTVLDRDEVKKGCCGKKTAISNTISLRSRLRFLVLNSCALGKGFHSSSNQSWMQKHVLAIAISAKVGRSIKVFKVLKISFLNSLFENV